MKIAQIAPLIERVPPKKYGGTERVIYNLTEELVRRGHDVTLFASGDSETSAKLISVAPKALREMSDIDVYGANTFTMRSIGLAYSMQSQFDVIHDHLGMISLPTANISQTPVIMTLHGAFTEQDRLMYRELSNPYLVSISYAQTKPAPYLHYGGNVYNGLAMEEYPFSPTHEGYLLYVGRISPEKGVHYAIETAKRLNLPLIIAAKLDAQQPADVTYYETKIKPELSETIRWIGEVDETERNKLMSKALCFLHPVVWAEPFGLTLIEAMACGCPVVAFNQGSIPEVIADHRTGYVVENVDQMVEAVGQLAMINRRACRIYALQHFSAKAMAEGYEKVYEQAIAEKKQQVAMVSSSLPKLPLVTSDRSVKQFR